MYFPAKRCYYFFSKQFKVFAAVALLIQAAAVVTALYRSSVIANAFSLVPFLALGLAMLPRRFPKGFRLRNGEIVFPKRFPRRTSLFVNLDGFARYHFRKDLAVVYEIEKICVTRTTMDHRKGTAKICFVGKIRAERRDGEFADDICVPVAMAVSGVEIYGVENAAETVAILREQFPRATFVEE